MGDSNCQVGEQLDRLNREIRELRELVNTDPLTGLFNVRHLRFTLEQEMERTRRNQLPTTFVIIDADHFKQFNDSYGHVIGDKVLIHLASLLKNAVRKIDIPCRYGGEEFGIILPSTPLLVGAQVAERIRQKVENSPLVEGNARLAVTVSIGVDSYVKTQSDTVENFIARADEQLYLAKQSGRNRVRHATTKISSSAEVTRDEKDALFNSLADEDDKEQKSSD